MPTDKLNSFLVDTLFDFHAAKEQWHMPPCKNKVLSLFYNNYRIASWKPILLKTTKIPRLYVPTKVLKSTRALCRLNGFHRSKFQMLLRDHDISIFVSVNLTQAPKNVFVKRRTDSLKIKTFPYGDQVF